MLLGVLASTQSRNSYSNLEDVEWNSYKMEYNKNYTELEDLDHIRVFQANKRMIKTHNKRWAAGKERFEMGINQFSDLTDEQFAKLMMGGNQEVREQSYIDETDEEAEPDAETEPDDLLFSKYGIDWRELRAVTPVQPQGHYNNSWAFAAAGAIEGCRAIATKKLVALSKQNLVDCCQSRSDHLYRALKCIKSRGGIQTDASYRYRGAHSSCKFNKKLIAARLSGVKKGLRGSEEALSHLVYKGPVAASISIDVVRFYKGGIYNRKCRSPEQYYVLIVGYGYDVVFGDYWLLKTSLGTAWGEKGYIRLARNNDNLCGIANGAVVAFYKFS